MAATTLFDFFGGNLPSLSTRGLMYQQTGLGDASAYTGSAEQNTALLARLSSGTPATPTTQAAPPPAWATTLNSVLSSSSSYTPAPAPLPPSSGSSQQVMAPQVVGPAASTPYISGVTATPPPSSVSPNNITSNVPKGPITTSALEQAAQLPDPVTLAMSGQKGNSVATVATAVATTTMTSVQTELDSLLKKRDELLLQEKAQAEQTLNADRNALVSKINSTASQDAYNMSLQKYDINNKIDLYQQIQTKIIAAQEALNMGIIYEGDRFARMDIILGRQASLQKQGLALIGALQGTAAVIKGNIDLGLALANATVNAIQEDNKNSLTALSTLINLDSQKLVSLTAAESAAVKDRIEQLNKEIDASTKNKDLVLGYMKDYPEAFLKGGVTLLDTPEQALVKMLPTLSVNEQIKFNADIAAKNRSNSGKTDASGTAADKTALLDGKSRGMTYGEAVTAFGGVLDINWINSVYQESKTGQSAADLIKNLAYEKYMNPDGSLKPNIIPGVDSKGTGTVTAAPGYTLDPVTGTAVKEKPSIWESFTSLFS